MDAMKETVLIKATEMFLALGFKSVTMDDIAAELGISKKTIYQHFANKNDLVEESAIHLLNSITSGIADICKDSDNPIEEFFIIRKFLSTKLNNESSASLYQLQKYFPKTNTQLHELQFKEMHKWMVFNLEKGIKKGMYRSDIDLEFIARIYFTGIVGLKNISIFPLYIYDNTALTGKYIEYHLRSIVTPKGLEELTKTIAENIL